MKKPTILVLGASGMLGSVVFSYLKKMYPTQCFGTEKLGNKKDVFSLQVKYAEKDIKKIQIQLGQIDYVVNCIGLLPSHKNKKEMKMVNALFPLLLSKLLLHTQILHVSTDGVFSPLDKKVFEKSKPHSIDIYGQTKLLGEIQSKNFLSIRTSLLGFDPKNKSGILSWIQKTNEKSVQGFSNQIWTGCTTLQFAQFAKEIIQKNTFYSIRKKTPVLHFVPIKPTTKYMIVKTVIRIFEKPLILEKTNGEKVSRILASQYKDIVSLANYSQSIQKSLQELYEYNKKNN